MASYAASARIGAGAIRLDRPRAVRDLELPFGPSPAVLGAGPVDEALEDVRVIRSWASGELRDRWLGIREAWTQTTFFVVHPESWR
jgi:hypothetical protein